MRARLRGLDNGVINIPCPLRMDITAGDTDVPSRLQDKFLGSVQPAPCC